MQHDQRGTGDNMNKPKSERICNCGRTVKASQFSAMAGGYQAWGFCSACGTSHAFNEWRDRR